MDGWVPVPTKPTITVSRYQFLVDIGNRHYQAGFNDALTEFGVEIVDDPEPTNKDRLSRLIDDEFELSGLLSIRIADHLDKHGVTAPEGNA